MRKRALVLVLAALALACSAAPDPSGSLHSETASGPYLLTLDLPSGTWGAGQPITGQARLNLTQGDARKLSGSGGGLIGFSYAEVGGRRRMDPAFTADCKPHQLSADSPLTTPLQKSGGFSRGDPDADFYRAFITAPFVALPAGKWDITAVTDFVDGAGCSGSRVKMQTTVRVTITP